MGEAEATFQQIIDDARMGRERSIAFQNCSSPSAQVHPILKDFPLAEMIWNTANVPGLPFRRMPHGRFLRSWVSTQGAYRLPMMGGAGCASLILPIWGAELWVVGTMPDEWRGRPDFYDSLLRDGDGVIWEPVILRRGEAL